MADYPIAIQPGQDPATKIAAAAGGLVGGLNDYARYQTEKQLATQKMQAGLLSQGLTTDQDGNVTLGPVAQSQYQQQQKELDPTSETSRQFREYGKGLLSKAGLDQGLITDPDENGEGGTSAYTVKQMIQEAKPAVSGQFGLLGQQARGAVQQQRIQLQQGNQAAHVADEFDEDKIISPLIQQKNQIQRDKHTLDNATTLTPQVWNEIQLGLGNAIAGGKTAAVSTEQKVEINNIAQQYAALKQRITNSPEDIGSPEFRKNVSDTFDRLDQAYGNNIAARAKQKGQGRSGAYANNPAALKTLQDKEAEYESYGDQGKGLIPTSAPSGNKPPVTQNGHTYNWNPQTGAYE